MTQQYPVGSIYAETHNGLSEYLGRLLDLQQTDAGNLAAAVVEWLRVTHSGAQVYYPILSGRNRSELDTRILELLKNNRSSVVARALDVSERRVRQAVERERSMRRLDLRE